MSEVECYPTGCRALQLAMLSDQTSGDAQECTIMQQQARHEPDRIYLINLVNRVVVGLGGGPHPFSPLPRDADAPGVS